jgi:hypothetical protein
MSSDYKQLLAEAFPEVRPPRRNLRFASAENAPPVRLTVADGTELIGILENESYSGIAAIFSSPTGFALEGDVSIDYFGHPMPGVVRRIVPQKDGTCLIGVEWTERQ